MMIYDQNKVEILRQRYPEGTRICLDSMENDPHPIPSGAVGTVKAVDDAGNILMKWDNGRSLSLIPGEDCFHKIQQEETESLSEEAEMDMSM
ncbi:DUF4314 domain-containing protein [Ruminococcus sp. 25CYCFAH16]|jgi:hypothetical protein